MWEDPNEVGDIKSLSPTESSLPARAALPPLPADVSLPLSEEPVVAPCLVTDGCLERR